MIIILEKWYPVIWLVLAVALCGAELLTVQFISVWFALGAAAAVLVSLTGVSFVVQFAVFVLVSCLALLFSRPLVKNLLNERKVKTNADAVVGMEGVVTEQIDNIREVGRVLVNGMSWSARGVGVQTLEKDQRVVVERIEGVKLMVLPVPQGNTPPN